MEAQTSEKKTPPPPSYSFTVNLTSGKSVKITYKHTIETILRHVKVEDGVYKFGRHIQPIYRRVKTTIKGKRGEPDKQEYLVAPVQVRGCRISIKFDGHKYEGRSCCKPPDIFKAKVGIRRALDKIFKTDSGISLNKFEKGGKARIRDRSVIPQLTSEDRKEIYQAILRKGKSKKIRKTSNTQEEATT